MNQLLMTIGIAGTAFGAAFLLAHGAVAGYGAYRRRFTDVARSRLQEAFVFIDPERVFLVSLAGGIIAPLLLWLLSGMLIASALVAVLAIVLPRVAFVVINRRRRLKIVLQLPDAIVMLSSALRAGTNLQIALDLAIRETPAPLAQEFGVVVREQRLGMALDDALESMAKRLKLQEIDLVVAALTISRAVGGNLAETLDRLAGTLRAKVTMEGKIRALTSQGKLQGLIVGMLPVFLIVVLSSMQRDAMQPLFHTYYGWAVLGVIGILEMVGFLMISKIVAIDV